MADMQQLQETAPEVYQEFKGGNFVIKESIDTFNQVHTDQALEHINRNCKVSGGLVGITCTQSALDRWMLTCNDQGHLFEDIHTLFGLSTDREQTEKEKTKSHMGRDEVDVMKILDKLREFNPFGHDREELVCISTNDVAPQDIKEELLTAKSHGDTLLKTFIDVLVKSLLKDFMIQSIRTSQKHLLHCIKCRQETKQAR
jgi:hypothetical protein